MSHTKETIFTDKKFVVLFALTAVLAWGFAYPLIKIGMIEFQISADDTGAKMLFAGIRFFLAGCLTMLIAKSMHRPLVVRKEEEWRLLFLLGLINTAFHYYCFYIGLSNCSGARASIIDSLGTFWLVILACVIFKEPVTSRKVIGCIVGFAGIIVANIGQQQTGQLTLSGEGMILLNTVCAAFGGILTRIVTRKIDALTATGYSLGIGGLLLILGGVVRGGALHHFTVKGLLVLIGLIAISTIGFTLYNQLLCHNPVGEIAIFNALIPVFGTILCCVLLGEPFHIKYCAALLLVGSGIYIINRK